MAIGTNERLARMVLKSKYCSRKQMQEALLALRVAQAVGAKAQLAEVLLEKRYITHEQLRELRASLAREGPKQTIAGYELLDRVGQGGMGAVFRARQKSLNRAVALKILPKSLASDVNFIHRFQREAKLAARLNHPNLVQVIDVGEDRGYHFIAMEFVEGVSAGQILQQEGRISEDRAVDILLGVAKGLQEIEARNVVHRDIKPSNILISQTGHVKLSDMGLAKPTDGDDLHLTRTGASIGTPNYMSPEQAKGGQQIDIRTDIYALGASVYHLLTGQPPFSGKTSFEILRRHVDEPVTPPRVLSPDVSAELSAVIVKMMAKRPDDRYQTPSDLIEAVRRAEEMRERAELEAARRIAATEDLPEREQPAEGPSSGVLMALAVLCGVVVAYGAYVLASSRPKPETAPREIMSGGVSVRRPSPLAENVVRRVTAECIGLWGGAGGEDGHFREPCDVSVAADGRVYVSDRWNHRLQIFEADGRYVGRWPEPKSLRVRLFSPAGVTSMGDGRGYLVDAGHGRVLSFDAGGRLYGVLGGAGWDKGELRRPIDVAVGKNGRFYVTECGANRVQVFSKQGSPLGFLAGRETRGTAFSAPHGIAIGADGVILVVDSGNERVVAMSAEGSVKTTMSLGAHARPVGICLDASGRIYVTDARNHRVCVLSDGELYAAWGEPGREHGRFSRPEGIAVGPDGTVYVADTGNHRVVRFRVTFEEGSTKSAVNETGRGSREDGSAS